MLINTVRNEGPEKVLKFLYDDPEWKLVYLGHDGLVFLKDIKQYQKIIEKYNIDLNQWKVQHLNEYRLGSKKVVPYYHINKAYSLEAMGFDDAAIKEARAALWIYPGYAEAFALIGQIHAERDEIVEAFHYFRLALTYNTSSRKIRTNLAKMYELLGKYDEAIEQYKIVVERFPDSPEGYFLTARAFLKAGDLKSARQYAIAGFGLDSKAAKDIIALGDILFDNSQYVDAVDMYAIALKGEKRLRELRLKLGDAFAKMGVRDRALQEWGMAVELSETDEQKEEVVNRINSELKP